MDNMEGSSSRVLEKEWDGLSCPICMDHPHTAVMLICSSHDKGCRTFICDTSYRHSNCLYRFRKLRVATAAARNEGSRHRHDPCSGGSNGGRLIWGSSPPLVVASNDNSESSSLRCPLCRGEVKGWMILEETRRYLDLKPRACSRESCSFSGNYKELHRHARRVHPRTRPGVVDPSRRSAWRRLEHQRDYGDILSAIRSALPGAVVVGDYAIDYDEEPSPERGVSASEEVRGGGGNPWWMTFFPFQMLSRLAGRPFGERLSVSYRDWRPPRRRPKYTWGENLLGRHGGDGSESDGSPIQRPRRRRRLDRFRSEEHP